MTYREMRQFTESMRSLGYSRHISMENFRRPNFLLVAEILRWLVLRYDVNADVPDVLDSEQDRVLFIKHVAHFMATRAHIKLNTKRLYQADGYAVKEMLKVTSLLYAALLANRGPRAAGSSGSGGGESSSSQKSAGAATTLHHQDILLDQEHVTQLRTARNLAGQITRLGAELSDKLRGEVDTRSTRSGAIGKQLEIRQVETNLQNSIARVNQERDKMEQAVQNVAADEANLDARVEKRRGELERNMKRLGTLQSVRPAHMDEYEQLERELDTLYAEYLVKFRNLAFMESQYEALIRQQDELQKELTDTTNITSQMRAHLNSSVKKSMKGDTSAAGGAGGGGGGGNDSSDDMAEWNAGGNTGKEMGHSKENGHAAKSRKHVNNNNKRDNFGSILDDDGDDDNEEEEPEAMNGGYDGWSGKRAGVSDMYDNMGVTDEESDVDDELNSSGSIVTDEDDEDDDDFAEFNMASRNRNKQADGNRRTADMEGRPSGATIRNKQQTGGAGGGGKPVATNLLDPDDNDF